ncbi:MAG: methyltransferase domain-containing protein [Acidimicrobiales bacterium]
MPADRAHYPLRNAAPDEADRLAALQSLHDASTIRQLERLGIAPGWRCLELGAGAGSIARWMADTVGDSGSVTAIDQDTALLTDLGFRANVSVVRGDLATVELGAGCVDLAHSRSVLMHVEDPQRVVERVVRALAPGGVVLFEEADGAPAQRVADDASLPAAFRAVMVPLAARWTWARDLAAVLEHLGLHDVHDDVRENVLHGATPGAAFWIRTLTTIRPLVTDAPRMAALGRDAISDTDFDAMLALLDDPDFAVPFAARHRVSGRLPA